MRLPAVVAVISCSLALANAVTWTATPFIPASVPLAVRSPYLSAWLNQGNGTALNDAWPVFWTGSILGWAGFAKVDGAPYNWMGTPNVPAANFSKAEQKSLEVTSTQSIFVMTAGPVDLTITFLSPVEPADYVNQSLPLSYLAVSAASNDGKQHSVQVYADISAEWISGDNSLQAQWSTTTGDVITHQVHLASQSPFTEIKDRAQYGTAYHSTPNTGGATFQTGADVVVRTQFINHGALLNSQDTNFRGVSDNWPVFALAHDLGNVNTASTPAVFSVGHARDPAIEYIAANNVQQQRSSVFWAHYLDFNTAISTFLGDYSNALTRAGAFDARVSQDATQVSSDYAALVALSIRQTFGATELTVQKLGPGGYDTSDIMMFVKEISSDGNVNTADIIYAMWPLLLYINASLGKQVLLPLLAYQATGQYPNAWAAHDLGTHYPVAIGHNDGSDQHLPVEECGNMLIMALSYTQRTNDTSLIHTYYSLLDGWAQFLVQNALSPPNQPSADSTLGSLANQTNLAIKGIIGIKAMSEIADIMGDNAKSSNYDSIASTYAQEWQTLATSADGTHLTLTYGNDSSWGLTYNLYADKLLGTNIVPESLYSLQTKWYSAHTNSYGVPLDSRQTLGKSDWQIWAAAFVTDNTVRDSLIGAVRKYAANGQNTQPFTDAYDTLQGTTGTNPIRARPVVGGHLALLALLSNSSIAPGAPSLPGSSSNSTTTSGGATPTSDPASNSSPPGKSNAGLRTVGRNMLCMSISGAVAGLLGGLSAYS